MIFYYLIELRQAVEYPRTLYYTKNVENLRYYANNVPDPTQKTYVETTYDQKN